MSLNIQFVNNKTDHVVDFAFQTSTPITKAIIDAETNIERIDILRNEVYLFQSKKAADIVLRKFEEMLNDPDLELSYI